MKKRILPLIIAVTMCFTIFAFTACKSNYKMKNANYSSTHTPGVNGVIEANYDLFDGTKYEPIKVFGGETFIFDIDIETTEGSVEFYLVSGKNEVLLFDKMVYSLKNNRILELKIIATEHSGSFRISYTVQK